MVDTQSHSKAHDIHVRCWGKMEKNLAEKLCTVPTLFHGNLTDQTPQTDPIYML